MTYQRHRDLMFDEPCYPPHWPRPWRPIWQIPYTPQTFTKEEVERLVASIWGKKNTQVEALRAEDV